MRWVRVKVLTTNNLQVLGHITLTMPPYCERSKISDLLNNSRNFIDLTDVEVYGDDEQLLAKMPFLCINKPAIALVLEDESSPTLVCKTDTGEAHSAPQAGESQPSGCQWMPLRAIALPSLHTSHSKKIVGKPTHKLGWEEGHPTIWVIGNR